MKALPFLLEINLTMGVDFEQRLVRTNCYNRFTEILRLQAMLYSKFIFLGKNSKQSD